MANSLASGAYGPRKPEATIFNTTYTSCGFRTIPSFYIRESRIANECGLAESATRLGVFEESRGGLGNRDRSSARLRLECQLLPMLPVQLGETRHEFITNFRSAFFKPLIEN